MSEQAELVGYQYIARRPCGKVSAMAWDDPGHEKDTAKFVSRCIRRGDAVSRVAVHKGDPMPDWVCQECRGDRKCKETSNA